MDILAPIWSTPTKVELEQSSGVFQMRGFDETLLKRHTAEF